MPEDNSNATSKGFEQASVLSFESRRAAEITKLIAKHGGTPYVSPSMREAPIQDSRGPIEFAHRLVSGQIDAMILLTGVGTKIFVESVERHIGRQRLLDAMADIPTLARGPKPTAVLRDLGITPTYRAPAPNTWREVLSTFDTELPVANLTIGIQEYGQPNPSLIAGLEARGATVDSVQVYSWELPEDLGPLEQNAQRLARREADVVMFTSANQLNNLLQVAEDLSIANEVREGLTHSIVVSIGPTTSERLRDYDLPIDLEATSSTMGRMVQEAAANSATLRSRKSRVAEVLSSATTAAPREVSQTAVERQQVLREAVANQPWAQSDFLRACRREKVDRTPIWLMRQAGRYMSEYRAVREKTTFLELCKNPKLCSEVMCTAVDFLGVDAAIIFSDLLPILEPMGMDLEFAKGEGPIIHNPVREATDVDRLLDLRSVDALHYVVETVQQTRADLPSGMPLIGFAGAPFTLASYAIEGGGSRNYLHTKTLMQRDEGAWRTLMQRLGRAVSLYLNAQIAAGAQAVQIFDSWVGCLGPNDYRRYVLPYTREVIKSLDPRAVVIHFGAGNPELLPLIAEAGGDVIGIDWRIGLREAWDRVGPDKAVQGNLDPISLLADQETIKQRAAELLQSVSGRAGHIFNLGHGIVPQTPPANAKALVEFVHEWPVD